MVLVAVLLLGVGGIDADRDGAIGAEGNGLLTDQFGIRRVPGNPSETRSEASPLIPAGIPAVFGQLMGIPIAIEE